MREGAGPRPCEERMADGVWLMTYGPEVRINTKHEGGAIRSSAPSGALTSFSMLPLSLPQNEVNTHARPQSPPDLNLSSTVRP